MIKHRVINGALMIGALVVALFLPVEAVFLIIPVLSTLMLMEFYALMAKAGWSAFPLTGVGLSLLLIFSTALQYRYGLCPLDPATMETLLLSFSVFVIFIRQCFVLSDSTNPFKSIGITLLGLCYLGFVFNFYTKILLQWPEGDGRLLLFYMILVVKVTDMGAYFVGCSLGKHKLIPRISPAKTWEGCAGGVFFGLVVSLIFWWACGGERIGPAPFRLMDALIMGLILPVVGIIGDLIESLIKRSASVKDSGDWVKGMGGILDILDSLLFAGPVFYFYLLIIMNA